MKLKSFYLIIAFLISASALVYANNKINFITITDIHLNINQKHVMKIDPSGYDRANDMDKMSFQKLATTVKQNIGPGKLIKKPNFVLYLGDSVGHEPIGTPYRKQFVKKSQKQVFMTLQNMFPDTAIINLVGNNDSAKRDYGPFSYQGVSPYKIAMDVGYKNGFLSSGTMCVNQTKTKDLVFPCLISQNSQYGFFTIKLQKQLFLIGLNSVMFSPRHHASSHAINTQLHYLIKQLKMAKERNVSVLLAMHIPVGNNVYRGKNFWKANYEKRFLATIKRYHKQVIGLLVAHTHMEEFKILHLAGNNIGEYFTAGLSTSHGNSPSIKLFTLEDNKGTWAISNYITYQIHQRNSQLILSKYYDFVSTYCKRLKPIRNINNCLSKITFKIILPRYTVNNPNLKYYDAMFPKSFILNDNGLD